MYFHSKKGRVLALLLTLVMILSLLPQAVFAQRNPSNPLYWGRQPSLAEAFGEYFMIGIGYDRPSVWALPGVTEGVLHHYNAVTAGNRHKPGVLLSYSQPNRWIWNWGNIGWAGDADGLVRFAEENDMAMIGHTLTWHGQSVAWLTTRTDDQGHPLPGHPPVTREQAIYNMHRYISTVASRYRGQIYSWDVLNEVMWGQFQEWSQRRDWRHFIRRGEGHRGDAEIPHGGFDPSARGNSQWYSAFANGANRAAGECGTDFIYYAFKFARRYDPFAVLYYNDYNDEAPGKRDAIAAMVIDLNNRWAHDRENNPEAVAQGQQYNGRLLIEGIGMQAHYSVNRWTASGPLNPQFYNHVRTAINLYRATGARISITELDIALNVDATGNPLAQGVSSIGADATLSARQLEMQAQRYAELFRIWLENQDYIARITFWNINDYHCWIRHHQANHVDRNWNIKPAWTAVMETLRNAPAPNISRPVINEATIPRAVAREDYFGYQFTAQRTNFAPITWSVSGGTLPQGMRLNPATGVLLGRPTEAGTFNFTVSAENARYTETRDFTIEVAGGIAPGDEGYRPLATWEDAVALGYIDISQEHAGGATTAITNAGITLTNRADAIEGIGINVARLQERFGNVPITVTATINEPPGYGTGLGLSGSSAGSEWGNLETSVTWTRDNAGPAADRAWGVPYGYLRVLVNDGVDNPNLVITLTEILIDGEPLWASAAGGAEPAAVAAPVSEPTPAPAPAAVSPPPSPTGDISVILDGNILAFDVPPQVMNDRTMVPLRTIFEAMGATVEWDNATRTAVATRDDTVVSLAIGNLNPTINGQTVPIDQAGVIVDDRTLAPLRFVAEAFGGTAEWDGATRTAMITTG